MSSAAGIWKRLGTPRLALALLALGCGAPSMATDAGDGAIPRLDAASTTTPLTAIAESGARLRARWTDGGDGALVLDGWYDSVNDNDCDFVELADGTFLCLPAWTQGADIVYLDSSCTRLAVSTPSLMSHGAVLWAPPIDCPGPQVATEIYVASGTHDAVSAGGTYYVQTAAGCVAQPLGTALVWYAAPLERSQFVAAHRATTSSTDRLGASVLVADDGSRQVLDVLDHVRGEACVRGPGDDMRCLPGNAAWGSGAYFATADCTTMVAYSEPRCGPPTLVVIDAVSPWELREPGASMGTSAFATDGTGTCSTFDDGAHAFWEIGGPAAPDAVARFTTIDVGTGRLRARFDADHAGGPPLALHDASAGPFFDTERGEPCAALDLVGVTVCVPAALRDDWVLEDRFSDAACSTVVIEGSRAPGSPLVMQRDDGTRELFTVGSVTTVPTFTRDASGCHAAASEPGVEYHDATPLDPTSMFATITRRHD